MNWERIWLTVWTLSIPLAIWAMHKAGTWNFDTYVNGLSAGILVSILGYKAMEYISGG